MRSVRLELMRLWCDRAENRGNAVCFMSTKYLIHPIAGLCDRLEEYRLSILCLYLTYGATLEDQQSATIEQAMVLRNLSMALMRMGNYVSARKILTMAINLEDPVADPEVKLMNQLILCDLQLRTGALDEPLRKLAEIRKEAEARGIGRIVVFSDMVTSGRSVECQPVRVGFEINGQSSKVVWVNLEL